MFELIREFELQSMKKT